MLKVDVTKIISQYSKWFKFDIDFDTKILTFRKFESIKDTALCLQDMIRFIRKRGNQSEEEGYLYKSPLRLGDNDLVTVMPGWKVIIGKKEYLENSCIIDSTSKFTFTKLDNQGNNNA